MLCAHVIVAACGRTEDAPPAVDRTVADISAELIAMGHDDQHVREGIDVQSFSDSVRLARMAAVDSANTARLAEIVREHGWPGRSRFGDDAARAAFLVVQHSPSHEFRKSMLELLSAAAETGEAEPANVAMLTDRVLTDAEEPQLYGTQFRISEGRLVPYPIGDADGLDARRAAAGLPPMTEYVRLLRESYGGVVEFDTTGARDAVVDTARS